MKKMILKAKRRIEFRDFARRGFRRRRIVRIRSDFAQTFAAWSGKTFSRSDRKCSRHILTESAWSGRTREFEAWAEKISGWSDDFSAFPQSVKNWISLVNRVKIRAFCYCCEMLTICQGYLAYSLAGCLRCLFPILFLSLLYVIKNYPEVELTQ